MTIPLLGAPRSGCNAPIVDRRCADCGRWALLDLYSCAGGAAMGYHRAGFCVTGVDIDPQPRYPFHHVVADALAVLAAWGTAFAAVHTSPPCQAGSAPTQGTNKAKNAALGIEHPQLIAPTRAALADLPVPSVIENVRTWERDRALGVRPDLELCGDMFPGLAVIRHRYFEINGFTVPQPAHTTSRSKHRGYVRGWRHGVWREGPYFQVWGDGGGKGSVTDWQNAMGIDWTYERHELAEAIPPVYATYIGHALRAAVETSALVAA